MLAAIHVQSTTCAPLSKALPYTTCVNSTSILMAIAMANTKPTRAALNTKHTKKRSTAKDASGNKFDGLEVEEPYDYFPLMDLPRELRDRVQDDALTLVEAESTTAPVLHILVGEDSSRRLTTVRHGSQHRPQARGALALSLVSKQIQ